MSREVSRRCIGRSRGRTWIDKLLTTKKMVGIINLLRRSLRSKIGDDILLSSQFPVQLVVIKIIKLASILPFQK